MVNNLINNSGLFIIIFAFLFIVITVIKGFKIVPQAETMIIERLGKYNRTLHCGINIIWPILEKTRYIQWRFQKIDVDHKIKIETKITNKIDLREQLYDFPSQSVITKDNVSIEINALLYFQITDPVKSTYEIANLPDAIEKITQTTLRNILGELDLDESLSSRDTINNKLRGILDEATDKWGVKINRVELQDINPPEDVQDQMEKQMRAERERRAAILRAEGEKRAKILESEGLKESEINNAEGIKQASILKAEGEAQARINTAQAEAKAVDILKKSIDKTGDPLNYLIAIRYIETLKDMVSGKDNKVIYLPYEATGILSSIGGIKEMLKS